MACGQRAPGASVDTEYQPHDNACGHYHVGQIANSDHCSFEDDVRFLSVYSAKKIKKITLVITCIS